MNHTSTPRLLRHWFALAGLSLCLSSVTRAQACSPSDFQSCKSCSALAAAANLKNPSAGDYYRGAEWNALYSAYVNNCPVLAAQLIKAGASPVTGGTYGSMIITVSSKWPHNNKKTNEAWAAILLSAEASARQPVKSSAAANATTEKLAKEYSFKPDYPDIYLLFQQ